MALILNVCDALTSSTLDSTRASPSVCRRLTLSRSACKLTSIKERAAAKLHIELDDPESFVLKYSYQKQLYALDDRAYLLTRGRF